MAWIMCNQESHLGFGRCALQSSRADSLWTPGSVDHSWLGPLRLQRICRPNRGALAAQYMGVLLVLKLQNASRASLEDPC